MSVLEWPADLTDLRLPPAWDGRPVDWHGWHPPIEARTLFLCENNGLRRDPQPCSVLLQCLFDRFGSVFPQCGLMVFPGVVIVSR